MVQASVLSEVEIMRMHLFCIYGLQSQQRAAPALIPFHTEEANYI